MTNFGYVSCNVHKIILHFGTQKLLEAMKIANSMHASLRSPYPIIERMYYLKASVIEKQLRRHSRDIFMEFTDPWEALEAM